MGALTVGLQRGVENVAMMQPIGFPYQTFHPIAIYGMFEKAFGNTNNYLAYRIFFCDGQYNIVALQGRTKNTLSVAEQL